MGTAATTTSASLRQLLRSLCHNTQWKYAIYWKLTHRSRMLLTWEDGYCDYPQPRDSVQHLSDNVGFNDTIRDISFDHQLSTHDGSSEAYSIGLAVANMSCLMFALGEGVVGKVALTGMHSWVCAHEFNSKFVPQYPDEWHLQFAFGVKTILLVPVVPHGVVQLGSIELVSEDLKLVADIKNLFSTLYNVDEDPSFFSLCGDFLSSSSYSPLLEDFTVSSDITDNPLNPVKQEILAKKDLTVPVVGRITGNNSSTNSKLSSHFMVQDKFHFSQNTKQHLLGGHTVDGSATDTMYGVLLENLSEPLYAQNQFLCTNNFQDTTGFACLEEELHFSSQHTAVNHRLSAKQSTMLNHCVKNVEKNIHTIEMNSSTGYGFYSGEMVDEQLGFVADKEISHETGLLDFPADSELHKALWPALHERCLSDATFSGYDRCNGSTPIDQTDLTGDNEPSCEESVGWFVEGGIGENLLDAVFATVNDVSEECAFDTSNYISSRSSSSGQGATCSQTRCRSSGSVLADVTNPRSYVMSTPAARSGDVFTGSPSGSSSRATSTLIDEAPPKSELEDAHSRRAAKSYQVSKRKVKTSSNVQKPRPRDRQMIQDRMKELREIVPNGSKCSIDALLDRTIQHMLFLQKVTNRAEKLQQCLDSKVRGNGNWNESASQSHRINASWAFEFGSKPGVYPIIVENLDQPGHMLVEMLCEGHVLFLEIAQVIRNLELTILKGVMEKRSDNIWAHFIIEVSRGFQRMDILWPLMQLLQRSQNLI